MLLKGTTVAETFYPFVENGQADQDPSGTLVVRHSARIAVFDDLSAAPRVVVIEPADIRTYLEQITATVTRLAQEQGGKIPFTVIREVVENLIHAYFMEPTVSILDGGNTIRFSDQGPGIEDKVRALEFGTTSATTEMKRYIRGVGSGLPYAQQWLEDKGGSLKVEDNIHQGTVVTISLAHGADDDDALPHDEWAFGQGAGAGQPYYPQQPVLSPAQQGYQPNPYAPAGGWAPYPQQYPQQGMPPQGYPQQGYPQQGYPYPTQPYPYPQQPNPYQQQPMPGYPMAQAPQQSAGPHISERGAFVLEYLRTHESVGPRDLNALNPLSESTWSRVLSQLEDQGLVSKQGGQKRHLTPQGRQFLGLY